ncbi:Hypothetical predicted protein [Mytilus galloprovincialis]|uniref:Uncharacterized protein n=1 Tax=Mytilus galloprovincialis TaxID=29158 RepID=A0A8B6ETK9_MYTGA|nr:Hypothetical predicted protein [Mytilus galloprovincialis]
MRTVSHPAPSRTDMQRHSNEYGDMLVDMYREDMKQQREIVKQALERSGFPTDTPIPAECDTRYNNALFGSRTRTPFQPGTQATTT